MPSELKTALILQATDSFCLGFPFRNAFPAFTPMNRNTASEQGTGSRDPGSWAIRLATASASLSLVAAAPTEAEAAIVKVTSRPVSLSLNSPNIEALWDIDGFGDAEFRLRRDNRSYMFFQSVGLQGLGLAGYTQGVPILERQYTNEVIGSGRNFVPADLANGNRNFGLSVLGTFSRSTGFLGSQLSLDFSATADNFFGFRFDLNGNTHYGYGIMQFDLPNETVTISSWAYESNPGEAITVGPINDVPGPIGLAGLAAGAAWTRKLRRRIREAA